MFAIDLSGIVSGRDLATGNGSKEEGDWTN
jgi:hypothetical protein